MGSQGSLVITKEYKDNCLLRLNRTAAGLPRSRTELYGRLNELIYGLLDSTGVLRMFLGSYGSLRSLRGFLVVVLLCLLLSATPFLCLYAGPTHSIVLTIVHFDSTPLYPSTLAVKLSSLAKYAIKSS